MKQTASAVVLAAGSSSRMGFDKLGFDLGDGTVLGRSLRAFDACPRIGEIVLVTGQDTALARQEAARCHKPVRLVPGGSTRAESARKGVEAASGELVAIHDAARPFVSQAVIEAALEGAAEWGAAAPAVPVKDTIKRGTPGERISAQLDAAVARLVTDDASLFELAGLPVRLTAGDYANIKITTREDLPGSPIWQGENAMRIGHGYDVHRLVEGRPLILGGVDIPFEKGLLGHSDADVLAHAVMDAVLGAAALGDIGQHFPDSDPAYAGADSLALARRVAELVRAAGWQVGNIDATILCQRPKLAPHIPAMRQNLASAFGLPVAAVSVKATTEEHLGFTGEGLGIAAHAVALIQPL